MSIPIIMNGVQKRKVVVFSGGSAANSLVDVFDEVIEKNNCSLTYVIPISDNGGSSSELIRVFGGPGIGDVRSTSSILRFCTFISSLARWLQNASTLGLSSLIDVDLSMWSLPPCSHECSDILHPLKVVSSV